MGRVRFILLWLRSDCVATKQPQNVGNNAAMKCIRQHDCFGTPGKTYNLSDEQDSWWNLVVWWEKLYLNFTAIIRLHFRMSSWQPNPNAKPFTPASAYFTLPIPCKRIRIRKKGILSRIIQWVLVIVLCVTVVINFIFIWDTTKKYSRDRNGVNPNTADERFSQLELNEKTGMISPLKANLHFNRL